MFFHTDAFTHRSLRQAHLHTDVFTRRNLYTRRFSLRWFYKETLHTDAFYKSTWRCFEQLFTHRITQVLRKVLRADGFTQKTLHTVFFQQVFLHTDAFTYKGSLYTQTLFTHRSFYSKNFSHTETLKHRRFYTQKLSHTDSFCRQKLLHTGALHTDTFTHRPLYTQSFSHRCFCSEAFTNKCFFYTQKPLHTPAPLHTKAFTHRCFCAGKAFTHKNPFPQFWTIDAHFVREAFTESKPNPNFPPVFDGQHAFGGAQGVRFMSMGTAGGSKDFICVCFLEDLYACIYTPASIRLPLRTCIYTAVDTWVFPEDLDLLHTWR